MVTLCWAAKGGSGTTVVTAALALRLRRHSLLVDLDGELPAVLGLPDPDRPGIDDWLRSDASADQLGDLVVDADATTSLLPHRRSGSPPPASPIDDSRWSAFAHWLRRQHDDGIEVFVDGGIRDAARRRWSRSADHVLLVTRPCYLSLRRATRSPVRPTGVILVDEPGRALKVPRGRTVPRRAGRRRREHRPSDRPRRRRRSAGRPPSVGHRTRTPRGGRVMPTVDRHDRDDAVLDEICARAASCVGDVDAIVEGEVRRAFPLHSRDDQQRLARAGRGPPRRTRRARRVAPRPDGRRGARQRRLRDLGRPRRHGHVGRSAARPTGRASPRTDPRTRSAGVSTAPHRSSTPVSPTGRGCVRSCRPSRSTVPSCRSGASRPTHERSANSPILRAERSCTRSSRARCNVLVSGATSSGKTSLLSALLSDTATDERRAGDRGHLRVGVRARAARSGSRRGRRSPTDPRR